LILKRGKKEIKLNQFWSSEEEDEEEEEEEEEVCRKAAAKTLEGKGRSGEKFAIDS
jgi:hypothetical protein